MEAIRPSRAKAFFDQIRLPQNGAGFLASLITTETATYESEFLDFKGGRQLVLNKPDFAELWAKSLSCFANSDGGGLSFSVSTRQQGKPKTFLPSET